MHCSKLIKDKENRKSTSEFVALILVLNEHGVVMNFALTKTEGLKELRPLLESIKAKCPDIQTIASGKSILIIADRNCGQVRRKVLANLLFNCLLDKTVVNYIFLEQNFNDAHVHHKWPDIKSGED